ncbi:hypothetical protein SBA7_1650004 [Candidatus Sulfotelmatobacter sp. SbA7]|jgi:hypothetical protein|nr:hypothetical protein SBA7_1650004 [Candidatus Sulfotelmatobacter sp. SbA7]
MTLPEAANRAELLQGTLDMLILRTLLFGPAHGHQIAKHIQRTTDDVLQVEHGSLYPALHRMERKRWIVSKWEKSKVGAVIGLCGAFAAGQLMSGLLFGVSPVDPATFIGGAAGLLLVAAMASAIPGIRAMRIQLVAALVHE